MDVALVSCRHLPEPDFDAPPLTAALDAAGITSEVLAWDEPSVDWSRARLTLLRSCWNYHLDRSAFLSWAEHVATVSEVWNPLPVVRWSSHKRYLLEIERHGVAITPTSLVRRGSHQSLEPIMADRGWSDVVVKPAVSAASYRTLRADRSSPSRMATGEEHLRLLASDGDVLVQRYLPSVEDYGERAVIWIDGALTHAVRKFPRFAEQDETVSEAVEITKAEADLACSAIETARTAAADGPAPDPSAPLYARIDLAPGPEGTPVVMELELIEPSLFFPQCPAALDRFVRAIRSRLDRAR